jgi:hypothetical protein
MKKIRLFLLGLTTVLTVNSFAQTGGIPRPSLSIGVEGALPLGDFSDRNKFGIGGSAKFAFPVAPDLDLTLSAGYISFAGKNITPGVNFAKLNTIPIKAGVRYRAASGLYVEPQLGYTSYKATKGFGASNNSSGAFTYAANIGYTIGNGVDFGVRYEAFSKNEVTTSFVGARLAYSFSL